MLQPPNILVDCATEQKTMVITQNAKKPPETAQIGQPVEGGGIYVGIRNMTDKTGLTRTFDVYAAPADLVDEKGKKLLRRQKKVNESLAETKDLLGRDGECFEDQDSLDTALLNGTYKGGWISPPSDIVEENLYKNTDKGVLKGTFVEASSGSAIYWTCTVDNEHDEVGEVEGDKIVIAVDFTDGTKQSAANWHGKLPVRFVYLEERAPSI